MRFSDYTRKTQELAEQKKQFEEEAEKDGQAWGAAGKPDEASLKSFQTMWNVFKFCNDNQAKIIRSVFEDTERISQGMAPVGPLAGAQVTESGQPVEQNQAQQSELFALRKEIAELKKGMTDKEQSDKTRQQQELVQKAEQEVSDWIDAKEKNGVKVTNDELQVMAHYADRLMVEGVVNPKTNKPYSYDDVHLIARAAMGKTEVDASKKVIQSAKQASVKSSQPPSSKAPVSAEAEAFTEHDILMQEAKKQGAF
jgi:hypothetical protein